jgi:transcription elongation factor GreB
MEKSPISAAGMEKLHEEWEELWKRVRPKLLEEIAAAAAQGDRSENAEYIYGRKKLREIDARLRKIEQLIESSQVFVDTGKRDKIYLGAKVSLEKITGGRLEITLVGPNEIDPLQGFISTESPMGKALLGNPPEGLIEVEGPRGRQQFNIIAVDYPG